MGKKGHLISGKVCVRYPRTPSDTPLIYIHIYDQPLHRWEDIALPTVWTIHCNLGLKSSIYNTSASTA